MRLFRMIGFLRRVRCWSTERTARSPIYRLGAKESAFALLVILSGSLFPLSNIADSVITVRPMPDNHCSYTSLPGCSLTPTTDEGKMFKMGGLSCGMRPAQRPILVRGSDQDVELIAVWLIVQYHFRGRVSREKCITQHRVTGDRSKFQARGKIGALVMTIGAAVSQFKRSNGSIKRKRDTECVTQVLEFQLVELIVDITDIVATV
jgi:hypothetical protein